MLICPNGHGPREGRYCPDCGGELIVAAPGGDSLRIRSHDLQASASVNPTFILPGATGSGGPPVRVKCIECGKKPLEAETFDCMGPCGRANLCLKHFDETYSVCDSCAALRRGDAQQEAARVAGLEAEVKAQAGALRKVEAEVKVKVEALAQAEAQVKTQAQTLAHAEAALAEWRPRAERAEKALAQAEAQVKAKANALTQVEAEVKVKVEALAHAEVALAEWRGRAEKAEGQLAEIARKAREAEAARQAELKRQREAAEAARRQAEEAAKQGSAWQQIGIELIKIPAGEFLYGDDKQKVALPEFWLAKTPVTNAQYKAFVDATGHQPPSHWSDGQIPKGKETHPVVNVSWDDAQAFCRWAGLRLPAEQEWEKAARGTDGREYPWGSAAPTDQLCNFNRNVKDTTSVGRYSPAGDSPYGLADMAGNVREWCEDWYDSGHKYRVMRGGSWLNEQWYVRAAYRDRVNPEGWLDNLGFRCARSS